MGRRKRCNSLLCLQLLAVWLPNSIVDGRGDPMHMADDHPDLNEVDHEGMIFVGRHCNVTGKRLSAETDNRIVYWFGTAFDDSHKELEWRELLQHYDAPDLPESEQAKSRAQVIHERKLQNKTTAGPIRYGSVEEHPLDGGITPVQLAAINPFWLDKTPVTNAAFAKFVNSVYHETEAEKYGWSFVLSSFLDNPSSYEADPDAPQWRAVTGAYWRYPTGPDGPKYSPQHPVVHVSHRDAAAYCTWRHQARLPGEREFEAAARHSGDVALDAPHPRTAYAWGEEWEESVSYNLWHSNETFPSFSGPDAVDGYRGTSPVTAYPDQHPLGFADLIGNVWEWQRGGKHGARIVRGASFVDAETVNHHPTLGARATLHGTTTAQNIGFRCAKAAPRRTEHHYVWHDEEKDGKLDPEDILYDDDEEEDWDDDRPKMRKKKVVYKRPTPMDEL